MTNGRPAVDFAALEARIGYSFRELELATRALTHISAASNEGGRSASYQRLEFLGDKVLGVVIAAMLFAEFPNADEGELSRRLADLVRKESCAEVAAELELGEFVRLGPSELLAGSAARTAILADVCEALIGAVYLDGGADAAGAMIARSWRSRMLAPRRSLRDPKTMLQEWAQGRGAGAPDYREVDRSGPAHAPRFVVAVTAAGQPAAEGIGPSKRVAEQAAAQAFLAREGLISPPDRQADIQ